MKCASCGFENPAASKFCSQCGFELKQSARCEGCGQNLPEGAQYCPACGYQIARASMVLAPDDFEHRLYRQSRSAFYNRFVERVERKSAESSLYGVVRLLARRPIELDMLASVHDLAAELSQAARPYLASLRTREVVVELSEFLATTSGEVQRELARLDVLSRNAAAELIDHPISRSIGSCAVAAAQSIHRVWPGIGACIGPAIEPSQVAGKLTADSEILLHELNLAFLDFVAAYDRLWLPLFSFVERFVARRCNLLWKRFANFEVDFLRYSAAILEAKKKADACLLDEALAAARLARLTGPEEPLAPLLEGQILYLLGRHEEALAAFEQTPTVELPFVCLKAEKLFWTGRCFFDEGRYDEAIASFVALVALPKSQVEARYFMEGEFLLAQACLLTGDFENGSRRLAEAILDGFTAVAGLLTDGRLEQARRHDSFRATLRSSSFLQALSRQAGIHPLGSTYLSRDAAPLKLASAAGAWLKLDEKEEIIFFFDASRKGSGRYGLCLTDRRLLWRSAEGRPQLLPLEQLRSVQMGETELVVNGSLIISDQVFDRIEALHQLLSMTRMVFLG